MVLQGQRVISNATKPEEPIHLRRQMSQTDLAATGTSQPVESGSYKQAQVVGPSSTYPV